MASPLERAALSPFPDDSSRAPDVRRRKPKILHGYPDPKDKESSLVQHRQEPNPSRIKVHCKQSLACAAVSLIALIVINVMYLTSESGSRTAGLLSQRSNLQRSIIEKMGACESDCGLPELTNLMRALDDENAQLRKYAEEAKAGLAQNSQENAGLLEKLRVLQGEAKALENKVKSMSAEIAGLKDQQQVCTAENARWSEKEAKIQGRLKSCEKRESDLLGDTDSKESKLASATSNLEQCRDQLPKLEEELRVHRGDVKSCRPALLAIAKLGQEAAPAGNSAANLAAVAVKTAKMLQADSVSCQSNLQKSQKESVAKQKLIDKINAQDNNCWQRLKDAKGEVWKWRWRCAAATLSSLGLAGAGLQGYRRWIQRKIWRLTMQVSKRDAALALAQLGVQQRVRANQDLRQRRP